MPDEDPFTIEAPKPSAARPLLGQTVLLVEDSLTSSEALRLMCCRSGARVRRADCLTSARRHLAVYRPSVLLVDLVLPDGSGLDLIAEAQESRPRVPALLGMSAHASAEAAMLGAGADGFLAKPMQSLAEFQTMLLNYLPDLKDRFGLHSVPDDTVSPDPLAFRQDLALAADLLGASQTTKQLDYAMNFLGGVAHENRDTVLGELLDALRRDGPGHGHRVKLSGLISDRLSRDKVVLHA